MPNTSEITAGRANILLLGDSGKGKTPFLGTIPKLYIFDFDAGLASIRNRSVDYDTFKDLPRFKTDSKTGKKTKREPTAMELKAGLHEWGKGWHAFIKKLNDIGEMMDKGTCPYTAVALDSLTFLSDLAMNAVVESQSPDKNGNKEIHQGSYQAHLNYFKTVLDNISAWPIRFIATAQVQRQVNELTQSTEKLPLVAGQKLPALIPGYFDEVWFCNAEKKDGKQRFYLENEGDKMLAQARSRWGVPTGTDLNWDAVRKYIEKAA